MQSQPAESCEQGTVLVLATGGTIAGLAPDPARSHRYDAAQLGVQQLVAAVPALVGCALNTEQVAQVDSKDMGVEIWAALAHRIDAALHDPLIHGIVVTHGTDTLEETARLLARLFTDTAKPVVLTAAMRPANAPDADGPQNLADAVAVARSSHPGVWTVLQRRVWSAAQVRKLNTCAVDAFGTAEGDAAGTVADGDVRWAAGAWDRPPACAVAPAALSSRYWPRVEIVTSHAGADGRLVDLLVDDGAQGLVVAGTGNGSVHVSLEAALQRATARGVRVVLASRVGAGRVQREAAPWPCAGELTPAQARVDLLLALLGAR